VVRLGFHASATAGAREHGQENACKDGDDADDDQQLDEGEAFAHDWRRLEKVKQRCPIVMGVVEEGNGRRRSRRCITPENKEPFSSRFPGRSGVKRIGGRHAHD
jgi:hypothetical protein